MLVKLSADPTAPLLGADCVVTVGSEGLPTHPPIEDVVLLISAALENGQHVELLLRDYEVAELISLLSTSKRLDAVRELAAHCRFDPSADSNF